MEIKIQSLADLGQPRHYIGLEWRSIEHGKNKDKDLQGILKREELTHCVVVNGQDQANQIVHAVGLAPSLTQRYYSAASVVTAALTSSSKTDNTATSDAVFVQKLPDGSFWYLLIIDQVPASGENDLIYSEKAEVIEKVWSDMSTWRFENRDVRFYLPEDIHSILVDDLPDIGKNPKGVTYQDIIAFEKNFKFSQIKAKRKIKVSSGKDNKKAITYAISFACIAFVVNTVFLSEKKDEKSVYIDDSLFTKTYSTIKTDPEIERQKLLKIAKEEAKKQEAKWLSQRLSASNPLKTISSFETYIDSLPVNVGGWFPSNVNYNLRASISNKTSSTEINPDINYFVDIKTTWKNTNGTVNSFRLNSSHNGRAVYSLSGEVIEVIESNPIDTSQYNFDVPEALDFLNRKANDYLDIMDMLQKIEKKGLGNFSWAMGTNTFNERTIPFLLESGTQIVEATIPYTQLTISMALSGFYQGYNSLKEIKHYLDDFPSMVIRTIDFNLETEEISIQADYYQKNNEVNETGKES